MSLQGKLVSEITREDVRELTRSRAAEDLFIDFKEVIFHRDHRRPHDEIDALLTDLVSFANAFGGHILVGVEDRDDCAWQLRPLPQAEARRIATKLKALSIQYIRPAIVPLEIVPFRMEDLRDDWIVIISVPEGQAKPHMSSFGSRTVFSIRDGNRNRAMTVDELQGAFLAGPQQSSLASIYREIQFVRSIVEADVSKPRRRWWKLW